MKTIYVLFRGGKKDLLEEYCYYLERNYNTLDEQVVSLFEMALF
jgi:hypothetical protein